MVYDCWKVRVFENCFYSSALLYNDISTVIVVHDLLEMRGGMSHSHLPGMREEPSIFRFGVQSLMAIAR